MKLLIIDHEASHVQTFEQALTEAKYEVLSANTGEEGIHMASTQKPDLILLGEMLPNTTGSQVLQQLKATDTTKDIPVAILSNFKDEKMIENALALGAVDYIIKADLAPTDLVKRVSDMITQAKNGGTGWQSGDAQNL